MSNTIEFWEQQLEMHKYAVKELERIWFETHKELDECTDDNKEARNILLNELRDYRTAIARNKTCIKKINMRIAILKNGR